MVHREGTTFQLQQLLQNVDAADPDAWAPIIAAAEARMMHLTRRMLIRYPRLRRWEQTGDVFQTAMMKLHRSLTEVQPDSPKRFLGLAVTQIRRTLIDLARHHFGPEGSAAHHASGILASGGRANEQLHNKSADDDQPETFEAWAPFHEAVDELPAEEREVFQLVWYGGMEQSAVAALLDVSVPTVQRRWYRARRQIGKVLSLQHLQTQRGHADDQ